MRPQTAVVFAALLSLWSVGNLQAASIALGLTKTWDLVRNDDEAVGMVFRAEEETTALRDIAFATTSSRFAALWETHVYLGDRNDPKKLKPLLDLEILTNDPVKLFFKEDRLFVVFFRHPYFADHRGVIYEIKGNHFGELRRELSHPLAAVSNDLSHALLETGKKTFRVVRLGDPIGGKLTRAATFVTPEQFRPSTAEFSSDHGRLSMVASQPSAQEIMDQGLVGIIDTSAALTGLPSL